MQFHGILHETFFQHASNDMDYTQWNTTDQRKKRMKRKEAKESQAILKSSHSILLRAILIDGLAIRNKEKLAPLSTRLIKRLIQSIISLTLKLDNLTNRHVTKIHVPNSLNIGDSIRVDELSDIITLFQFVLRDEVIKGREGTGGKRFFDISDPMDLLLGLFKVADEMERGVNGGDDWVLGLGDFFGLDFADNGIAPIHQGDLIQPSLKVEFDTSSPSFIC